MRIHGSFLINRRTEIDNRTDYKDYEAELREDFGSMCGYCGKDEIISTKGMEIDHFIPKRIAPEMAVEYKNLVYSCYTCNRKKWGKWPTEDKNCCHNQKFGFIDPATEEYDKHLGRNDSGEIEAYSEVGEWMLKNAFHFHLRPMKDVWRASKLERLFQQAVDKGAGIDAETAKEIRDLRRYLFKRKE